MSFGKSIANVEIVQQVAYLGNDYLKQIKRFLRWDQIKSYAGIVHDKDLKDSGDPVSPHIHLMLKFVNPLPLNTILNTFNTFFPEGGIAQNHLHKIHRWASAIQYLTHANAPEKHQYDDTCVFHNLSVGEMNKIKGEQKLSVLLDKIDRLEVREYNLFTNVSLSFYTQHEVQIKRAFSFVYNREQQINKDRNMVVFFITGRSGVGKTVSAKFLCQSRGWSYCVSSSSNDPLQDYKGEDALILDDVRPDTWEYSDFLKLLDNHTNSSVKSRYNNKYMVYCKCIMITSTLNYLQFYKRFLNSSGEDFRQFERRLTYRVEITPDSIIVVGDDGARASMDNPVVLLKRDKEVQKAKQMEDLSKFGFKFT